MPGTRPLPTMDAALGITRHLEAGDRCVPVPARGRGSTGIFLKSFSNRPTRVQHMRPL